MRPSGTSVRSSPTRRWRTVRPLLLILLVAPFVFGGAAYAMFAAVTSTGQARFALSVSPSTQTVTRGRAISFSVKVLRADGFTGPIKLRVVGLPPWVRAQWQTTDGIRGAVLRSGQHAAMLTLRAPPRSRPGTRRVRIQATGDGRTLRRTLLLTVARPAQRRFTLIPRPRRRVVNSGASGRFRVRVARARGFRARVKLRVLGAPRGARIRVRGSALTVTPVASREAATHQLVIEGASRRGTRILRRYAVVVLAVDALDAIGGNPTRAVYPGSHTPIDLRLTNSHAFKVLVKDLRVSVRPVTSKEGCRGDTDFGVGQYRGPYPLVLRPGTTRLSALVADASLWPQLGMHNLPRNQDACRGARVRLDYSLRLAR
jgi:hypothetical protein